LPQGNNIGRILLNNAAAKISVRPSEGVAEGGLGGGIPPRPSEIRKRPHSKYSGSVAGRNADSVLPKLFSGGKDLAKPRLISRPQKGVWGMNAGGISFRIFPAARIVKS